MFINVMYTLYTYIYMFINVMYTLHIYLHVYQRDVYFIYIYISIRIGKEASHFALFFFFSYLFPIFFLGLSMGLFLTNPPYILLYSRWSNYSLVLNQIQPGVKSTKKCTNTYVYVYCTALRICHFDNLNYCMYTVRCTVYIIWLCFISLCMLNTTLSALHDMSAHTCGSQYTENCTPAYTRTGVKGIIFLENLKLFCNSTFLNYRTFLQQTFSIFDTVKTKKSYQFFSFIKIYQICFDKRSNPEYNPPPHHALHAGTAWCLGPVGRIFAHTAFYRPSLQLGKSVKKGEIIIILRL